MLATSSTPSNRSAVPVGPASASPAASVPPSLEPPLLDELDVEPLSDGVPLDPPLELAPPDEEDDGEAFDSSELHATKPAAVDERTKKEERTRTRFVGMAAHHTAILSRPSRLRGPRRTIVTRGRDAG